VLTGIKPGTTNFYCQLYLLLRYHLAFDGDQLLLRVISYSL